MGADLDFLSLADVRRLDSLLLSWLRHVANLILTHRNEALIANPTRSRQIMERIPAGRWGSPKDFEGAIVYLASGASDYVSGEAIIVDGGWMGR